MVRWIAFRCCFNVITGRKEVVAKVIFLHLFVILFTGGGVLSPGGVWSGGGLVQGGLVWGGVTPPIFFWFLFKIFSCWFFFWFFKISLGIPPSGRKQTQAYGQRAAGTHPTGMHSCFLVLLFRFNYPTFRCIRPIISSLMKFKNMTGMENECFRVAFFNEEFSFNPSGFLNFNAS